MAKNVTTYPKVWTVVGVSAGYSAGNATVLGVFDDEAKARNALKLAEDLNNGTLDFDYITIEDVIFNSELVL